MPSDVPPVVRIQAEDFDIATEISRLTRGAPMSAPW